MHWKWTRWYKSFDLIVKLNHSCKSFNIIVRLNHSRVLHLGYRSSVDWLSCIMLDSILHSPGALRVDHRKSLHQLLNQPVEPTVQSRLDTACLHGCGICSSNRGEYSPAIRVHASSRVSYRAFNDSTNSWRPSKSPYSKSLLWLVKGYFMRESLEGGTMEE